MLKLGRRGRAVAAGSDLPYCPMCQQAIRVDAVTGRCALGHRATAPQVPLGAEVSTVAPDVVDAVDAVVEPVVPVATEVPYEDPYSSIVYGRSDYDYSSESFGDPVTWDAPAAGADTAPVPALDDFVTWDEPAGSSSALDVDTDELPVTTEPAAQTTEVPASDLLDELDDAAHARRRAVGTIGATIAVSGAVFASIAALPL